MEEFKSAYPLIHNKAISPRFVTPTLKRPRLLDWLTEHRECRALVIAAGAGYGKTTLLWQWEQTVDFPCYWYKLDRNDRDWTLHISYLVEAVSQHHPGFGRRAHSILRQMGGPGSSRPGVTAFLLAEMHERLHEPCTFIIDDWQYVASVTEVRGLWNQILRDAPPTCRFIFLSRGKPHLQFARFKTHGGYAELRTDDLRLTEPEITELFRDVYSDPLTENEAAELERRTEGWAASLQLVEVSLRERKSQEDRQALIESITATSDSDLFQFLAEEVLDQQTTETRNFLLSTSILQQMTPDLAERLTGVTDGTRRLMQLEHAGLFTYRLDEARYRYHGLFRDFLERQLLEERSESEVTSLHIHAASYFETSSQWPEAIYHYLRAGLQTQAARLIARYGEEVAGEGRLGLADEWLEQLPAKTIRDNARLSLLHGETLGIRGQFEDGLAALQRAKSFFARKGDQRMQALALMKESSVFHVWGRPDAAHSAAKDGLALAPAEDRVLRLRLQGNIAITSLRLYAPLGQALETITRLTAQAAEMGLDHYEAIGLHNTGDLQLEMGDVPRAVKALERAADYWKQLPPNPFSDNYNLTRAYLATGDVGSATEAARFGVARTRNWRPPNTEALCGLSMALLAQGDYEEAVETLRPIVLNHNVGTAADTARIRYLEAAYLRGDLDPECRMVLELLKEGPSDPRLATLREPVIALLDHTLGDCDDNCAERSIAVAATWAERGACLGPVSTALKVAPLLISHGRKDAEGRAAQAILDAIGHGFGQLLRPWLRPLEPHAAALCSVGGNALLARLVNLDSDHWLPLLSTVDWARMPRAGVEDLRAVIERKATRDTTAALAQLPDADFGVLRHALTHRQATRFFLRSMGGLELRKGSWSGMRVRMRRRRTRSLLGLLAAHGSTPVSREVVLELLWPDSDPAAAVNSLNQTLFQLRREIDPDYRNGHSPEYVVSTTDWLQLDSDLVKIDWQEILRKASHASAVGSTEQFAAFVSEVVDGEFLLEARYEDWSAPHRQRVHESVREALLTIAQDTSRPPLARLRLCRAAILLDEFDELAHVALARAMADSGRRPAAIALLRQFAKRLKDEFDEAPSDDLAHAAGLVKSQ